MNVKRLGQLLALAVVVTTTSGCASYRVSSDIDTPATPVVSPSGQVIITEGPLSDRNFQVLGPVEVSVKKLTVFHKNPTKEQANEALIEKARLIGADAVINVTYTTGIGFTTWGYIDAKGTAVKFSGGSVKVTLVNPKTEQSVTCPEDFDRPRLMTEEQAAQQRAWHADFQRSHNRLPTPMEGCLKVYEILGFVRTATAEPLKPSVAPAERVYTNPVYRWSISYPSSWAVDSADVSFVRITSSTDNALCGIHSGAVPFKTVDEFADTTLANNEQYFRDRGQVFVISARRQISLPNDITGIDVLTGIGAGGKSRRVYILVDPRGFMIDCETYAKDWDRLEPFYDRIVKSFTMGK